MLELKNPHSILAALESRPRAVKSVAISSGRPGDAWDEVIRLAHQHGIPVGEPGRDSSQGRRGRNRRSDKSKRESERGSSSFARVEPPSPVPLPQLWEGVEPEAAGMWLALDQVQDPHNLGALFRLAGFFGVNGVVLMKDRSASLTGIACDVAAGAAEYVPFSVVPNLAQTIQKAQDREIFVLGTSEHSDYALQSLEAPRRCLLVVGNEGSGLRRLTRERCDALVCIPPLGPVTSLNVASATAACLALLTRSSAVQDSSPD